MSSDTETQSTRSADGSGPSAAFRRALNLLTSLVRFVTVVFAAVLVIHLVLVVTSANPRNGVAAVLAAAADHLTLGMGDLFAPASPSLGVILNYGLPAVVWLIVGIIVARLLRGIVR